MFLNRLNLTGKNAFLQLAHHVANIDERFCDKEQLIIDKYCMEMQMDDVDYDASAFHLSETLAVFEDVTHKKIVLLEIMGLVYSDGDLHKAEEAVLGEMISYFDLNPNLAIVYKEWAKGILALFLQGEALIHL